MAFFVLVVVIADRHLACGCRVVSAVVAAFLLPGIVPVVPCVCFAAAAYLKPSFPKKRKGAAQQPSPPMKRPAAAPSASSSSDQAVAQEVLRFVQAHGGALPTQYIPAEAKLYMRYVYVKRKGSHDEDTAAFLRQISEATQVTHRRGPRLLTALFTGS